MYTVYGCVWPNSPLNSITVAGGTSLDPKRNNVKPKGFFVKMHTLRAQQGPPDRTEPIRGTRIRSDVAAPRGRGRMAGIHGWGYAVVHIREKK